MKKRLLITVVLILAIAGCEMTPQQQMSWQNYSLQQQNLANQQNMQLRENAREINRQLQQQNSWQERLAQQQWWDNYRKNSIVRQK